MCLCLFASPVRAGTLLLVLCLTLAAQAQNPPVGSDAASEPSTQSLATPVLDDDWLTGVASLYYSSARSGLDAFECSVHPDWGTLFASAQKNPAPAIDPRVSVLNTVKITLHARMKGGSALDWMPVSNPDKPLDPESVQMLELMREATERTLEGFIQFWIPFMDGSVVPAKSAGLEIKHSAAGHTIHGVEGGTDVTRVFDNGEILQQFNMRMGGSSIQFMPAFQTTEQGLLVNRIVVRILPAGAPPEQAQEMHVGIEYQTIRGYPIPARLSMELAKAGRFNFVLDGCNVNPPEKQ